MVNTKYYLILLISVFLSLGLGIIVGISLQSKDVLEKQHSIIAQRLEEDFVGIRNENRQLRETINSLEESDIKIRALSESMFNATIKNKLNGLRVSLIEVGEDKDSSSLISLLKISGASIESDITLASNLFEEDMGLNDTIEALSQMDMSGVEPYNELAENLMDSLLVGGYSPLIKELDKLNLIHSSVNLQNSCDVIILAFSDTNIKKEAIESFSNNFIGLSTEHSIPVIVVETEESRLIDLGRYKKMGISTVHHANTLYGKLSLISLLYGTQGNYGYIEGSDGILPEELFPLKNSNEIDINDTEDSLDNGSDDDIEDGLNDKFDREEE